MTNADCIRRMDDEQLYDFLSEWECGDIDYSITFCDLCKQSGNELNLDCDGCRKHWLQSDAVDVGGLMYWKRNTTFEADTPQTDCETCKHYKLACELFSEICKYEPTTQTETQNSNLTFEKADEPQTDGYMTAEQTEDYRKMLNKAEHKVYGNIEDEPQTERSE